MEDEGLYDEFGNYIGIEQPEVHEEELEEIYHEKEPFKEYDQRSSDMDGVGGQNGLSSMRFSSSLMTQEATRQLDHLGKTVQFFNFLIFIKVF